KACIVAIIGDPGAAMLYGKGCEPGIRDSRPAGFRIDAKTREYLPMTFGRLHDLGMRLAHEIVAEGESFLDGRGVIENFRIGRDPNDCAQDQGRYAKIGIADYDGIQPGLADVMMRRIPAERINQDIDIRQDQLKRPCRSSSSIS